jgi:adenylate cyclase
LCPIADASSKNTGDGFLAMFDGAHDAARCALYLQGAVASRMSERPAGLRIRFRMALHITDAIIEQDDIYGAGVNIAARLQLMPSPAESRCRTLPPGRSAAISP